ncbi:MAG: c-type cytochrome, partial [Bryobacterales bacterium]|nr:c-type cytochrome [Bryobacterales bacterium]
MRILLLLTLARALQSQTVDFARDIAPVLETQCLSCHGPQKALAGLRIDTATAAAKSIVAGQPDRSSLLARMEIPPNRAGAMPPGGPQVPKEQRDRIRQWISSGAQWPAGFTITPKPAAKLDERTLVDRLHKRITAASKEAT